MTVHIYRCEKPKRIRRKCPHHKHLCYGSMHRYYDTTMFFFDCGTVVDTGAGVYTPPKLYKRIKIFKDDVGYSVYPKYTAFSTLLARQVPLKLAQRIAKSRLKNGGKVILSLPTGQGLYLKPRN